MIRILGSFVVEDIGRGQYSVSTSRDVGQLVVCSILRQIRLIEIDSARTTEGQAEQCVETRHSPPHPSPHFRIPHRSFRVKRHRVNVQAHGDTLADERTSLSPSIGHSLRVEQVDIDKNLSVISTRPRAMVR